MAKESTSDLRVDDLYFSALLDENENENENENEIFSVSDEKYAEELQFQEAIMASLIASQMANNASSTIQENPTSTTPEPVEIEIEMGEPSQILCEICVDRKESDEMFRNGTCTHSFCTDCISKHVVTKIQDNINTVTCPGLNCKSVIELDTCKTIIPDDVLARWDEALCESMIPESQRFYCPFKDCSAMLINDNGGEIIRESECPNCRRLFCAQCYVAWHPGVECEEYQRLNEDEKGRDDLAVRELAREKKWQRCPRCTYYVERTEGCPHITCRCKFEFCYECGADWSQHQSGCQ